MGYCPFRAGCIIDANTQGDVCFADLPWAVGCSPFGAQPFGYGSFLGGKNFGASGLIVSGVRANLSRISFSLKPGTVWEAGCRSHPAPMRTEAAASDGRRIFVTR